MGYNIRPMSFGEVLDRAFVVLRDHFWLIVGISATVFVPYGVLEAFAQIAPGPLARIVLAITGGLIVIAAGAVMVVVITAAVASVYLDHSTTVGNAYRATGRILVRVIGTYLLQLLFFLLCFAPIVVIFYLPRGFGHLAMVASIIGFGVLLMYLAICWSLLAPVMVVEGRFGMGALRRSRQLVRGAWWRTWGIFLIGAIIAQLPVAALGLFWAHIPILGPILNGATMAVTSTFGAVVMVIYYFDRRCRTEDFDLRLLAEQIRSEAEPGTQAMPGTSPVA